MLDLNTIRRLGYFYIGFRPQCCFFEVFFMLRKLIFIVLPVMPLFSSYSVETRHQASVCILLVLTIVCMWFHFEYQPYDFRSNGLHNAIEKWMLFAAFITVATQAFITATDPADAFTSSNTISSIDRIRIRNAGAFYLVLGAHLWYMFLSVWVLVRQYLCDVTFVRNLVDRLPGNFFAVQQVRFIKGGINTSEMSTRSAHMLAEICGDVCDAYLKNSKFFNFQNYSTLLQHVCTTAGYWEQLHDFYGQWGAYEKHQLCQGLFFDEQQTKLWEIEDELRLVTDMFVEMDKDGAFGEYGPGLSDLQNAIIDMRTNYNNYRDLETSVTNLYRSYLRTIHDVVVACHGFESIRKLHGADEDYPAAIDYAVRHNAMVARQFRTFEKGQKKIRLARHSVVEGAASRKTETRGQGQKAEVSQKVKDLEEVKHSIARHRGIEDEMLVAFQKQMQDQDVLRAKMEENYLETTQTEIDAEKREIEYEENQIMSFGGDALAKDAVLASHYRQLKKELNALQRENMSVAAQLIAFWIKSHQDEEYQVAQEPTDGSLIVHIGGAHFLREGEKVSVRDRALVKHIVAVRIVGRQIHQAGTRFTTPPVKDLDNPVWDYTGYLHGYVEREALELQVRDINEYRLVASATLDWHAFCPHGFAGDITLRSHTKDDHEVKSGPQPVMYIRISFFSESLMSPLGGPHKDPASAPPLPDGVLESLEGTENIQDKEDMLAFSDTRRAADAGETAEEAQERAMGRAWNFQQEIDAYEKEIELLTGELEALLCPQELALGQQLKVLSSQPVGGPTSVDGSILKVGQPIAGVAAARAAAAQPRRKSCEVQTGLSEEQEEANLAELRAEVLNLKFEHQQGKLKIHEMSEKIQRLHAELELLDERSSDSSELTSRESSR